MVRTYTGPTRAAEARENIREAEVKPRIEVITGDALDVIPRLKGEFDMVFLDAAKYEHLDYRLLRLAELKIRLEELIVAADNAGVFAGAMKDYLDYVRNSGEYRSRFVAKGRDGVEISIKL